MTERWPARVRFGGLGGQGLVTLGAVLAEAGALDGLQVAASQSYGSRARGGATRADVILSREEIDFPHVVEADVLVVLAQEAYELYLPGVTDGGLILADDFFVEITQHTGIRQLSVEGTRSAVEKIGNKVAANFVMLGSLVGLEGLVGQDSIEKAMEKLVRPRFLDTNLKAFELGLGLGQRLKKAPGDS